MAALNCNTSQSEIPAPTSRTTTKHVNRDCEITTASICEKISEKNQLLSTNPNRERSKSPSSSESDHTLHDEAPNRHSNYFSPKAPTHFKFHRPESTAMENIGSGGKQEPNQSETHSFKDPQKVPPSNKERASDSFSEYFTESETDMEAQDTFQNVGRLFRLNSRQVSISSSAKQQPFYPTQTYMSSKTLPEWVSAGQGSMKQEFFCNVIQHHDLEDQLKNLQQKLYQFQVSENPLEVISLRKELAQKEERIIQLESTILKINSSDITSTRFQNLDSSLHSSNISSDLFKARILSLKAALGQCSSVTERTIDKFLDGTCGLEDLRELVERAQSVESLAIEASQMEEQLVKMDTKYNHFQNLIIQCEEKSKSLDDQLCIKFKAIDDADAKWNQYQKQSQILALDLEKASRDLSETNSTVEILKSDIKKLSEKKVQSRTELDELETAVKNKRKQFEQIENSCNDALILLKRAKQEENDIQDSLEDYDRLIEEKENELKLLEKQVSKLATEEEEAKKCFLKQAETLRLATDELQMTRDDLQKFKASAEDIRKDHESTKEALKGEVEALEERKKSVDEFLGSIQEKYERLCEKAEEEAGKIKKYLNEVDAAETRRNYLVDLMQLEETQLEGLKQQHTERVNQLRDVQNQMNQEKHLLERTMNERNKCEQQLNLTKTKVENYSNRLLQLQQEVESLSSEVKTLLDDKLEHEKLFKDLNAQLDACKKGIESKNKELEETESNIQSQQTQLRELKESEKQQAGKFQTLQAHVEYQQKEFTKNSEANNRLKIDIANNRQKFELLERALAEMSQQMINVQKGVEQQKEELLNGQSQLGSIEDLKQRVLELEKANSGLITEKENLVKQVAELKETSMAVKNQNQRQGDKYQQLKQTISSLRTELSRALEKNKSLEKDLEDLLSEKVALKLAVADLEHKQVENRSFSLTEIPSSGRPSGENTPTANETSTSLENMKYQLKKQLEDAEQKFSSRRSNFSNTEFKTKAKLNAQMLHS